MMALSFLLNPFGIKEYTSEQLYSLYRDSAKPEYLQQLISLHGDALYYFLLRQSDQALADDISQQCWLKLIVRPAGFAGQSCFKTWLFSMARNCLIDELRRQQRWQSDDEDAQASSINTCPLNAAQQQQQQQQFVLQLNRLPFLQREALMLQLEGFSLMQIAKITGEGEETIKSRLRYARQQLQHLSGASHD